MKGKLRGSQLKELASPRKRRLMVREKSMSRSNLELTRLMREATTAASRRAAAKAYLATEYGDTRGTLGAHNKVVIAMVGLPARGKSYIVKMLVRYLEWIGFPTRIFNVGDLRRRRGMAGASADFFKSGDDNARKLREELAMACQEEMYAWLNLQPSSCVAIFDATNTTKARRAALLKRAQAAHGVTLIFIESICDKPQILEHNYRMKLQNADYKNLNPEAALKDFQLRVKEYEARYETIEDDEDNQNVAYIKIINVGEKVITRQCSGYLSSQISFFLGNVHITPRKIWLALHAESTDQREGIVGASAGGHLTEYGQAFAIELAQFISKNHAAFIDKHRTQLEHADATDLLVLTGNAETHQATIQPLLASLDDDQCFFDYHAGGDTANINATQQERDNHVSFATTATTDTTNHYFGTTTRIHLPIDSPTNNKQKVTIESTSLLNELCGGDFDGISHDELERRYPGVWEARKADKLRFRYPGAGGESYVDVIARLRPILIELERQRKSVLIVSHLAVQRCLYAYFLGTPPEQIPYLQIPTASVVELSPSPHGATAKVHVLVDPQNRQMSDADNVTPRVGPWHFARSFGDLTACSPGLHLSAPSSPAASAHSNSIPSAPKPTPLNNTIDSSYCAGEQQYTPETKPVVRYQRSFS
uniref:6-phosphofructo-2-kinase domain-containing protein n=1 Tax=Aureoumbra lagunensis TaxID=44058 RepID=A0A7S3K309_9STRA